MTAALPKDLTFLLHRTGLFLAFFPKIAEARQKSGEHRLDMLFRKPICQIPPVHFPAIPLHWHFMALVHSPSPILQSEVADVAGLSDLCMQCIGQENQEGSTSAAENTPPPNASPQGNAIPPVSTKALCLEWGGQCRGWLLFTCKVVEKPQSVLCGANAVLFALPRLLRALKCWSRSASLTMKRSEKWRPKPCSPLVSCLVQSSIYFLTEQHMRHLSCVNGRP